MPDAQLEQRRADYLRWHPAQVRSLDIDPMYPFLRVYGEGLNPEELAWMVFCHVVWYHPGSTIVGWSTVPSVELLPSTADGLRKLGLLDLPCETERRGHRPKQPLINHLLGLSETFAEVDPWTWANDAIAGAGSPKEGWLKLNEALMGLTGNGRWAAYKTAEMLQKVCGLPVEAADAGHRYSSGPRKGLALLEPDAPTGNSADDIPQLDYLTSFWADELGESDIAQVETSLCDFNSLVHGRYYLGHDIDSMLHAFRHPMIALRLSPEVWAARASVFDPEFLGEMNGWDGVRKDLNRRYAQTGELPGV